MMMNIALGEIEESRIQVAERPIAVFEMPEFKRWFAGSKAIDPHGKPMVFYHGTAEDIHSFDPARAGQEMRSDWGNGVYLTPSASNADYYRGEAAKRRDTESARLWALLEIEERKTIWKNGAATYTEEHSQLLKQWRQARSIAENRAGAIFSVYLSIKNPFLQKYTSRNDPFLADNVMQAGHDGIFILKPNGAIDEAVAFDPRQIKSAIGNNGQFDPLDPRIDR